jgi:subtilase family serine protease
MRLVQGSTNRLTITVAGTRAQVNRAFQAQIRDYQLGGRTVYANSLDPAVPAALAPSIQAIVGLQNVGRPHRATGRALQRAVGAGGTPVVTPSPLPNSRFPSTSMEVATGYNAQGVLLPSGQAATGTGQTIALVEFRDI